MKLNGKKIDVKKDFRNDKDFGVYPKSIMRNKNLTPVDKLILIACHGYPPNWILAHSRIAKEIGCDKSHVLARWKHLLSYKMIIETETRYKINYDLLNSEVDLTRQGSTNLLSEEALNYLDRRSKATSIGCAAPPYEYNDSINKKEQEKEDKISFLELSELNIENTVEAKLPISIEDIINTTSSTTMDNMTKFTFGEYRQLYPLTRQESDNRMYHELWSNQNEKITTVSYSKMISTAHLYKLLLNIDRRLTPDEVQYIEKNYYRK